jgi:hypothetical protein
MSQLQDGDHDDGDDHHDGDDEQQQQPLNIALSSTVITTTTSRTHRINTICDWNNVEIYVRKLSRPRTK